MAETKKKATAEVKEEAKAEKKPAAKKAPAAASDPVAKLIKSAAANATNNFGMAGDKLYVAEIQASDGVRMKRFEPRGKGASSPIIKRTSFMRVTVKER